jgi:hypothetical protein
MAKFFVGQRVRVTRSDFYPEMIGIEARIIEEALVEGDDSWLLRAGGEPKWYVEKHNAPYCLEPILPEGAAPSDFTFQQLMDSLQEVSA